LATREIRTFGVDTSCDVCGRTLLRGERAEVYLDGAVRRSVCDLCKPRALHEGWVREGTVPVYEGADAVPDRRGSLLGRLRRRREPPAQAEMAPPHEELGTYEQPWVEPPRRAPEPQLRERRNVHAVPMSPEHKMASAVDAFNGSEHPRTVAGVGRSLGTPDVSVLPLGAPSLVCVVVSWELCWYRYEVDLSDDQPAVRVAAQGYELDELSNDERAPNASADEDGRLELAG
jgi:hypothetical protein